jgi:hypothetical protein
MQKISDSQIFEVASSQTDIFVRWAVEIPVPIQMPFDGSGPLDKRIIFYPAQIESDVSYVSVIAAIRGTTYGKKSA